MKAEQLDALINALKARFESNMIRHANVEWSSVQKKLQASPEKLQALFEMELTGGEPDVVSFTGAQGIVFCDCAPESPAERRSLCYDKKALDSRKQNKPSGSAMEMAAAIGIEMLTEQQYRELQTFGQFDKKTSSWIKTPDKIRTLGGALFCDYRYDHVFVYHNGAESYYAARGFRGTLAL